MTTEAQLKSAADFLAGEALMRWKKQIRDYPRSGHYWFYDENDKEVMAWSDWCPYADTPEGLWQAKMIVEKMREQRADGSDGYNFNLNWQAHKGIKIAIAQFHRIDGNLEFGQGSSEILEEAITLAAATTLGVSITNPAKPVRGLALNRAVEELDRLEGESK